ncbi:MAG: helix-turn-helix domain-containing protein [Bacteroidales bacterium]|nr:helix-turn-helix domain-containing protein [Bacteroidales bacterium]
MFETTVTYDTLPQAVTYLIKEMERLHARMDNITAPAPEKEDRWMTVAELCDYLPQHPSTQTVYGWTSTNQIPFHKRGKHVLFLMSEIDRWLTQGAVKSHGQLAEEALAFIANKKKGKRA